MHQLRQLKAYCHFDNFVLLTSSRLFLPVFHVISERLSNAYRYVFHPVSISFFSWSLSFSLRHPQITGEVYFTQPLLFVLYVKCCGRDFDDLIIYFCLLPDSMHVLIPDYSIILIFRMPTSATGQCRKLWVRMCTTITFMWFISRWWRNKSCGRSDARMNPSGER